MQEVVESHDQSHSEKTWHIKDDKVPIMCGIMKNISCNIYEDTYLNNVENKNIF